MYNELQRIAEHFYAVYIYLCILFCRVDFSRTIRFTIGRTYTIIYTLIRICCYEYNLRAHAPHAYWTIPILSKLLLSCARVYYVHRGFWAKKKKNRSRRPFDLISNKRVCLWGTLKIIPKPPKQ